MLPFSLFPENLKSRLECQGFLIPEPSVGDAMTDRKAMQLAIQEGYLGLGFVSPNPLVGCVVLDSENRFLSKGFHAEVGKAHAEVNALKQIPIEDLKGASVFVTLEPCAHEGRTGSCAQLLAKLPLKKVIFGIQDPNPLVSGQGQKIIQQAGINCQEFSVWHSQMSASSNSELKSSLELKADLSLKKELEQLCEHFLKNFRQKKVFVSLKVASSLDGQLGLKNGESKWITDSTSREIAHLLRAGHDAILVGANTIRIDQPSLNIRHSHFPDKKNTVVVLDSTGEIEKNFAQMSLAKFHHPDKVIFDSGKDLNELLTKLWEVGIRSVLVEGGAKVLSSFISESLADRLYIFQAPMICGAKSGKSWSEQVNIGRITENKALHDMFVMGLDADFLVTGKLKT